MWKSMNIRSVFDFVWHLFWCSRFLDRIGNNIRHDPLVDIVQLHYSNELRHQMQMDSKAFLSRFLAFIIFMAVLLLVLRL